LISVIYPIVFGILELILEVKIIEGSIEYFYSMDAEKTAKDYIRIMRTYTILFAANTMAECIQLTFSFMNLMMLISIIGILLRLRFIILMHRLENDKINIDENKEQNDTAHIDTLI
jgi:hypothetical protein